MIANLEADIWVVWPTVNIEKSQRMIEAWHDRGYKVAVLVNPPNTDDMLIEAEIVIVQDKWINFPVAANILCKIVSGDIVVVVGDDISPDPNSTAQEIGRDFLKRFPDTFGVIQPTGDEFGCYNKCAVSPWLGRDFIEKAYEGKGPYWEEYFHYFSDQELQEYATQLGIFEQRKYVNQYHDHWQRQEEPQRPGYLLPAKKKWHKDKQIFQQRQKEGFPCQ
ncbi:MAG: glycosyltransferase family 2 protein [Candidatus Heimdallarchaeaceae archaeon]